MLSRFDASQALLFDGDRHLLAVIEASFGTTSPFNNVIRGIFNEKLGVVSRNSMLRAGQACRAPKLRLHQLSDSFTGKALSVRALRARAREGWGIGSAAREGGV